MIKDYIIKERLGIGAFGVVFKVLKKSDNNIYVIKQIPLLGLSPQQKDEAKLEAKILSSVRSPYIVRYFESFEEKNNLNIVMEYCDGGDLDEFINKNKKTGYLLKEDIIWNIFIKICIGLATLHKNKILHRDLKTLNIFLTKELDVKIGDFGVAKILTQSGFAKTLIGTPYYLSPELCEEQPYNDKSDVWALGCILYELCTYKHPFNAKSQASLIIKILQSKPHPIHKYYSENLKNLIYLILDKNHLSRPSCIDILNRPFVTEKAKILKLYDKIKNIQIGRNSKKRMIYNYSNSTNLNPSIESKKSSYDIKTAPNRRINKNNNNINSYNDLNKNQYSNYKQNNNRNINNEMKRRNNINKNSNIDLNSENSGKYLQSEYSSNTNIVRGKRNNNYNNHVLFISKSNSNYKNIKNLKENRSKSCERNKNKYRQRLKSNNIDNISNISSCKNNISNISIFSNGNNINTNKNNINNISKYNNGNNINKISYVNVNNMNKRNHISNISYINVSNNYNNNKNQIKNNKCNKSSKVINSINEFEMKMKNKNRNSLIILKKKSPKKLDNGYLNFEDDELLKNIKITDILENKEIDTMIQNKLSQKSINDKKMINMKEFANYLNNYVSNANKIDLKNNKKNNSIINKKNNLSKQKSQVKGNNDINNDKVVKNINNEKSIFIPINYSVDINQNSNRYEKQIINNIYNNKVNKNNEIINRSNTNINNININNIRDKKNDKNIQKNYSNKMIVCNQKKNILSHNGNIIKRINSEIHNNKYNNKRRLYSFNNNNDKMKENSYSVINSYNNSNIKKQGKITKISIFNEYGRNNNRRGPIKTDVFN